jgi:hypothetical protein
MLAPTSAWILRQRSGATLRGSIRTIVRSAGIDKRRGNPSEVWTVSIIAAD